MSIKFIYRNSLLSEVEETESPALSLKLTTRLIRILGRSVRRSVSTGACMHFNLFSVHPFMTNFLVSVLITYATMHQCLLPRVVNIPKDSIKVKIDLY